MILITLYQQQGLRQAQPDIESVRLIAKKEKRSGYRALFLYK
jgi:hypothetical protein